MGPNHDRNSACIQQGCQCSAQNKNTRMLAGMPHAPARSCVKWSLKLYDPNKAGIDQ